MTTARTVVVSSVLAVVLLAACPALRAGAAGETAAEGNGYAAGVLSTAMPPPGAWQISTPVTVLTFTAPTPDGSSSEHEYDAHAFYSDAETYLGEDGFRTRPEGCSPG